MKKSRLRTLLIGLVAGTVYAYLAMLLVTATHRNVSVSYIFVLPLVLGAIPVLLSTREQLQSYKSYLLLPWGITLTFFFMSFLGGLEGLLCLIIIVGPAVLLGTFGAFIIRLIKLRRQGKGTRLYASLLLPFIVLAIESNFIATDQIYTVKTSIEIDANKTRVWDNIKNVKDIRPEEIEHHFIHFMGVPKPLDGRLDIDGVGGTRYISWEKGIKFREIITGWNEGSGFSYDIDVDPASIPPATLDEHVMIGGKYFDVLNGSYTIDSIGPGKNCVTLSCTYRITTNLNFYSKWWADFILDDFNTMILQVIKKRSEANEK